MNVRSIILKYHKTDPTEKILLLTRADHIDLAKEVAFPLPKFVGLKPGGETLYAGHCDDRYGVVVVGVPNNSNRNAVNVAAHETAHLFLDPFTGKLVLFTLFNEHTLKYHKQNTG